MITLFRAEMFSHGKQSLLEYSVLILQPGNGSEVQDIFCSLFWPYLAKNTISVYY